MKCFSVEPVLHCAEGCSATSTVSVSVGFHCVPAGESAEQTLGQSTISVSNWNSVKNQEVDQTNTWLPPCINPVSFSSFLVYRLHSRPAGTDEARPEIWGRCEQSFCSHGMFLSAKAMPGVTPGFMGTPRFWVLVPAQAACGSSGDVALPPSGDPFSLVISRSWKEFWTPIVGFELLINPCSTKAVSHHHFVPNQWFPEDDPPHS